MADNPNHQPMIPGMSGEQFAEFMKRVITAVREPTDEEKAKKAAELARQKEAVRQSIDMAEQDMNNRLARQARCVHSNSKYHTFVGQNNGDGNTAAICQICGKDYKWRTTPDQMREGTNLLAIPGLTEAHILAWERQFPATGAPPDRIKLLTRAGKIVEWPSPTVGLT